VQTLPATLDPVESISNVGLRISDNVFDSLLRRDFGAERHTGIATIRPHLAQAVVQRDALTWVATLRPGLRFHDGGELTADDVAWTFSPDRLWGPNSPYYEGRVNWAHLESVTAEDRLTVAFRTKTPDPVMPLRLSGYPAWVDSKAAFAASGPSGGADGLRTRPIGTGPYKIASFARDQRIVLDSNDDYFQGRPAARQVIISAVPEGSARIAGLKAGDFDIITNLVPDQMTDFAGDPRLEALSVSMDLAHLLIFDTRKPALRDRRVRQALVHAVDTGLIAHTLWGEGAGRMAALQLPSFGPYYDRDRPGLAFDTDRARRLLAEAGWRDEELVVRVPVGYYVNMLSAVQIVQEMWRAVGVRSRLEVRENTATLTDPGVDVFPTSVSFRFADPLGGGLMVNLSRRYFVQAQGFWRPVRFNEIADALALATEPAERKRLWLALLDEYEAEAPALILYQVREVFAKRRDIRYTQAPLYYMDLRPDNFGY
jgi:peptide/nickel transport system substrate-binding protein